MATKTYHGSCHCQKVKFEADIDFAKGTGKCNCSICWKSRAWSAMVKPHAFRIKSGEGELSAYVVGGGAAQYLFCKHCGIRVCGKGDIPEIGGAFVSVNVATLDDVEPATLVENPIHLANGRADDWMNVPAEIRHL